MADLLNSLILPNSETSYANSSQDSFHSVKEDDGGPMSQPSAAPNLADASAHNGIQVYDIDAYLADPTNAAILESAFVNPKKENDPLQPVQLGTQTSHYVSLLYQACQTKGLTPIFDIEGEADKAIFRGVLRIANATITLEGQCRSKKEARERLAEKGVEVVKGMGARKKEVPGAGGEGEGGKEPNWVGMLQEYHNQEFGPAQSPLYTFYALGQSYACTLIMPSYPSQTFGSPTQPFSGKKLAQRTAAKEGVRFLISENKLNADGSTLARKKVKLGGGRSVKFQAEGNGLEVLKGPTYAQKVNDIAPILGLNTPMYHLSPESMDAPNILSGYVSFLDSPPGIPSQIGEVRNVFGKKAAKEEAAKGAWEVLLKLAESRGVRLAGEVDGFGDGNGEEPGG